MYRGIITFRCADCGKRFKAPDIEYMATVYSIPQPCPKCGSIRTLPAGGFGLFGLRHKDVYKEIWEQMGKDKKQE